MKRILRILPLAVALGALSALGGASSGNRAAGSRGEADFSAPGTSSVVSSALLRLATTAIPTHAMPADLGVTHDVPGLSASSDERLTARTLSPASRPLAGAATPRAPTR